MPAEHVGNIVKDKMVELFGNGLADFQRFILMVMKLFQ